LAKDGAGLAFVTLLGQGGRSWPALYPIQPFNFALEVALEF
jgi:hypothetical protein